MFDDRQCYTPIVRSTAGDYSAAALVGADSVVLGWDICQSADRTDLLGFGIRRVDASCNTGQVADSRWLNGFRQLKCFPLATPAEKTSSRSGPIQRFWWCDNTAESGTTYEYAIVPVRGTPLLSVLETPLMLKVTTAAYALVADDDSAALDPELIPEATTDDILIRLIRSAHSAILVSTPGIFSSNVAAALDEAGQRTLVYGFTDASALERFSNGLTPNVQLMSRAQPTSWIDPYFALGVDGRITSRTSAIVIDPWGDAPTVLLWSSPTNHEDNARQPADVAGLLICNRPGIAAMIGSSILRQFSDCKLSFPDTVGEQIPGSAHDLLESDGRWSGMYFSPYCRSYKYRERQVFAGYP